jgi:hypothetical protein
MTQTLVADVLDALLSTWRADATLVAYAGRLRIYDGPPVTDRAAEIELWVGATGLEPDESVISGTQAWVAMPDERDETLAIANAIWVAGTTTNIDISVARRTAIDVFKAAAAAIRGSTLGVTGVEPLTQVTDWQLRQGQFTGGIGVVLTFTVAATCQV